MAKGNLPVPPVANHKPPIGKHVPSAVAGAQVQDHSAAIASNVEQAPQTVGVNPDPPATEQTSGQAAEAIPYTAGATPGSAGYGTCF